MDSKNTPKLVIGIPTVRRSRPYLVPTVNSLLKHLNGFNGLRTRLVIFDGETTGSSNPDIAQLRRLWPDRFTSGLITVMHRRAPLEFSADGLSLKATWQQKQALDCAELFQRCSTLADYYLHVEDDVIASEGYLAAIGRRLESHLARGTDWRVLSFYNSHEMRDDAVYSESQIYHQYYGLIGQLIRCRDLPDLARYIRENVTRAPIDSLVGLFVGETGGSIFAHSPTLFQHVGVISSLEGRVQLHTAPEFHENHWSRVCRGITAFRDICFHQPRALATFISNKFAFNQRSAAESYHKEQRVNDARFGS